MAKYVRRRPGRYGCKLAWNPSRCPRFREEQADLSQSNYVLLTIKVDLEKNYWDKFLRSIKNVNTIPGQIRKRIYRQKIIIRKRQFKDTRAHILAAFPAR